MWRISDTNDEMQIVRRMLLANSRYALEATQNGSNRFWCKRQPKSIANGICHCAAPDEQV